MGRRKALFTEPDLQRALKVLKATDREDTHRVVIAPDGSIVVEPVNNSETHPIDKLSKDKPQLEVATL